jgi:hypothetical protein
MYRRVLSNDLYSKIANGREAKALRKQKVKNKNETSRIENVFKQGYIENIEGF